MYKYIAKRNLFDNDFKTQAAKGYGNIPKGAEVIFCGYMQNWYGRYAKVQYKGNLYYVDCDGIEKVTVEDEMKKISLLGCSSCKHFTSNGQPFCGLHELTLRARYERPCTDFERK